MGTPTEVGFAQLLFGSIGLMLLAAATIVGFLVTYQKRLLQQQLAQQMATAAHQQHVLEAIVEAQERERERIGCDLHDGIGATLASAKLLVNRLRADQPDQTPERRAGVLNLLLEMMGTAGQEVRSISHNLYPVVLARFGLTEAIQHLADVGNETGALTISTDLAYAGALSRAQELALYRICQELTHNALKHAHGATRLTIRLRQHGPHLELSVEDDGCGFGMGLVDGPAGPAAAASAGAGLRSIAIRAEMLGASLRQSSVPAPAQGTRTTIEMAVSGVQ